MADGSVKIDIKVDDSDAKKKLSGVEGDAESVAEEFDDLKDSADDAGKGLKDLGDSADDAGKGFDSADVAIGTFVGNALSQLSSKLVETIGNIAALADETREYRDDMAKLDTAFTTNGHSVETAQQTYDSFYRILGESDRTVEAVNHLAAMTQSEEELAQWSEICAGVTARFGDSLPIEGLTEAANHTAKLGEVQGPLADALEWAGISTDEFNEKLAACKDEQERAALITSTLNGEYAEAGKEYNNLTADSQAARDATNKMEQAQAALGAAIEPVTTAWKNMQAGAMQWLVDVGLPSLQAGWQWILNNIPAVIAIIGLLTTAWLTFGGAQQLVDTWNKIVAVSQAALNAVMTANPIGLIVMAIAALVAGFMLLWNNCEGFRNFFIGMWESIKTVLAPVIEWMKKEFTETWEGIKNALAPVIEWLKQSFAQAWEAIKVVWDFVQPYFTMIWENIKVVFGVAKEWFSGMFSAAWEAIKAIWDNVQAYFAAVWETIKGIFAVVKAVLSGNWSEAWEAIKGIVSAWGEYFQTVWNGIKNVFGAVKEWFGNTFSAAWEGIKQIWNNVGTYFSEIWTKIKNAFNISDMLSIGKNLLEGLWNGITDKIGWLKDKVSGVVDKIKSWFTGKDGFDEHSPSKWSRQVAVDVNRGTAIGFENSVNIPVKAAENVTDKIKTAVQLENARMLQGVGVKDTGFSDIAQAVGMQTAGINSLASEYRKGSSASVTIPLVLNGRELGKAIVDLTKTENTRTGTSLVFA